MAELVSLTPSTVVTGDPVTVVSIAGSGFDTDCEVRANGASHGSNYVSETEIQIDVDPSQLMPGVLSVTVVDGEDVESNALDFTIEAPEVGSGGSALLEELKKGNVEALTAATDAEMMTIRIEYEEWAETVGAKLKAQHRAVVTAIEAELGRRDLT